MSLHRIETRRLACLPAMTFVAVASLSALIAGCGSDEKPPPKMVDSMAAAPAPAPMAGAKARDDMKSPSSGSIKIEDRILKACGDIPDAHFAFDSASIRDQAELGLSALARCFVTGPLKGTKGLRLIGHADPRGEMEYNIALGQKRAGSVADYLMTKGLQKDRIDTLSKGELEATGTDEEGWARDRFVDVTLRE